MLKKVLKATLVATGLFLLATPAFAQMQSPVEVVGVDALGSGCRAGSFDTLAVGNSFAVLFASYSVQTSVNRPFARATCNVSVGLRIPRGITVGITTLDFRGGVAAPRGAIVDFTRTAFTSGSRGVQGTTRITSSGPFLISDQLGTVTVSGCRQATAIMRVNTALSLQGPPGGVAQIDSVDGMFALERIAFGLRFGSQVC